MRIRRFAMNDQAVLFINGQLNAIALRCFVALVNFNAFRISRVVRSRLTFRALALALIEFRYDGLDLLLALFLIAQLFFDLGD